MNFVIFSYNFLPQSDPEAYCTTRFASGLSRAGHKVIVVTMNWEQKVSNETMDALIDDNLIVKRVQFSDKINSPIKALIKYGVKDQSAVDVNNCANVVLKQLESLDNPILITRSTPVTSAMVGLKCRKKARYWVAHFSDPLPWFGYADTIGHKLLKFREIRIIRNVLLKADKISITCNYVSYYFKEVYGKAFNGNKIINVTHISDERLGKGIKKLDEVNHIPKILHLGMLYPQRGGKIIPMLMERLKTQNKNIKFVQVGLIDKTLESTFNSLDNVDVFSDLTLEQSLKYCRNSDIIFIPDVETDMDYSPVLPSKFAYRLFDFQPIVVYCKRKSDLHDFAISYPKAGIFWAEEGNLNSLEDAINSALTCNINNIDRTKIKECFSEKTIIKNFIKSII